MFAIEDKVYDRGGKIVLFVWLGTSTRPTTKTMYTCPMHPEIIQGRAGSCPSCGMDLVPMELESEDNKRILTYA
jgi:Cu2+-exporting ATPase